MPHDLFGDVVVRPPSTRSRRSSVVIFSVVAHAAALVALVIVPLFAAAQLPTPRRRCASVLPTGFGPVVVPSAPLPRMRARRGLRPPPAAVTQGARTMAADRDGPASPDAEPLARQQARSRSAGN